MHVLALYMTVLSRVLVCVCVCVIETPFPGILVGS